MDKKTLRKDMAARRAEAFETVDQTRAQRRLSEALADMPGPVSFYWPIRTEIDPRPVMEALSQHTTVCLPLTHGHAVLTFRRWTLGAKMEADGFGVPVPVDETPVVPKTLVVPMLAFDAAGHRLGYGAGHYDRTLAHLRGEGPVTAIGFAFEAQRSDHALPTEPTDQPLDAIVTEASVHRFDR
ncbi:MAG: 5-formyltetrahydrofolate cyclo-ligase [Paracoccaceae bacterium]|nr:5-formyltetrahydrofolate cyclo-ligase [Paracoccaceae bacterium]